MPRNHDKGTPRRRECSAGGAGELCGPPPRTKAAAPLRATRRARVRQVARGWRAFSSTPPSPRPEHGRARVTAGKFVPRACHGLLNSRVHAAMRRRGTRLETRTKELRAAASGRAFNPRDAQRKRHVPPAPPPQPGGDRAARPPSALPPALLCLGAGGRESGVGAVARTPERR